LSWGIQVAKELRDPMHPRSRLPRTARAALQSIALRGEENMPTVRVRDVRVHQRGEFSKTTFHCLLKGPEWFLCTTYQTGSLIPEIAVPFYVSPHRLHGLATGGKKFSATLHFDSRTRLRCCHCVRVAGVALSKAWRSAPLLLVASLLATSS
jgi:hypothetical protein